MYSLSFDNKAFCESLLLKLGLVMFYMFFMDNGRIYNLICASPNNFQQTIFFYGYYKSFFFQILMHVPTMSPWLLIS